MEQPVDRLRPPHPPFGGTAIAAGGESLVEGVAVAGMAAATVRAYQHDWAAFTSWCAAVSVRPLPAAPETVARFVREAAATVRGNGTGWAWSPATVTRRVAAVGFVHRAAGLPSPTESELVRGALRAVRRGRRHVPRQMEALTLEQLHQVLAQIPASTWPAMTLGARDRALLWVGWAGALRRGEEAAFTRADLTILRTGRPPRTNGRLLVRTSKTDQDARGATVVIPAGPEPASCPLCAIWRWLDMVDAADAAPTRDDAYAAVRVVAERARTRQGHVCDRESNWPGDPRPLFRRVNKAGLIGAAGIGPQVVHRTVKARAAAAGLDADRYGGHSLRAGFITEALAQGQTVPAVAQQSRHRNYRTVETYARQRVPEVGNAAMAIDLSPAQPSQFTRR